MKHPVSQTLYDYWNGLRGERIAPRRFEIEPANIAAILPDTLILERIETGISRFRLAGTRISDAFGIEFRGVNVLDLFPDEDRITLQRQLSVCARHGAVGRFEIMASNGDRMFAHFEMVLLPLTHTRDVIDRFVGSIAAFERPAWLGTVPLVERRIVENELVWPSGRPHSMIDHRDRQTPLMPSIREARIVRFDRRQFRVYEGGLSGARDEQD